MGIDAGMASVRERGKGKGKREMTNLLNWKFWLYLAIGVLLAAWVLPMVLEGQETSNLAEQSTLDIVSSATPTKGDTLIMVGAIAQFTIEERMSVKDKQTEYWRLQAQAASILLQASNLQMELTNEVMRLQAQCVKSGGRFDPGMVSCLEIQAQDEE